MSDEPLNNAIDEAARQLTEGAPADAAAFRRRVLARIEAGDAPRRSWRAAFVLSPIAVAAAMVIALFVAPGFQSGDRGRLLRQVQGTPSPSTTTAPQETVRLAPSPGSYGGTRKPDTAEARGAPAPPLRSRAAGDRAVAPASRGAGVIEPAAPPDSIAVAPLTVGAVSTDPIPIERLDTITPITIAPLDIIDLQRRFE
jgi:hypothetical protein